MTPTQIIALIEARIKDATKRELAYRGCTESNIKLRYYGNASVNANDAATWRIVKVELTDLLREIKNDTK